MTPSNQDDQVEEIALGIEAMVQSALKDSGCEDLATEGEIEWCGDG